MILPNLIHAGVPKSASATINAMLKAHPDVFLPRQKEPNFFNSDVTFAQGLNWYAATFFDTAGSRKIVGDMSISYATGFGFDVPDRIATTLGKDLKILLTFREPVARAFSQYRMARNKGQLERLDFGDAIDRALAAGPRVTVNDRLRARTGTYYSSITDMDVFRWCMYIEPGHCFSIFEAWANVFGADNVLVLLTENIAEDIQSQADQLFNFLELTPVIVEPDLRRNIATTLRYPWMRRALNQLYAFGPLRRALNAPRADKMRKILRKRLLSRNYVENSNKEKPDAATVERLRQYYAPQVDQLEHALGCKLDVWRKQTVQEERDS